MENFWEEIKSPESNLRGGIYRHPMEFSNEFFEQMAGRMMFNILAARVFRFLIR